MKPDRLAARVEALCSRDLELFDRRVREEADWLVAAIEDGEFDADVATVGLEYECYCVDESGALSPIPKSVEGFPGCEREIGRHQLELQVNHQPFSEAGIEAIAAELRARFQMANEELIEPSERLASDGIWTIPPAEAGSREYLTALDQTDPVPIASNMVDSVRYHAQSDEAATTLDAPHVTVDGDTALLNSLTTSIQPHFVVPTATELPTYFRYALRIAAPLLALGANSPLFPPDLYDDVDPATILDDAWMENRIGAFESVMNPPEGPAKVAFPADVDSVADAVDSIVEDPTILPVHPDDADDRDLAYLSQTHGSYWRWVRPVFDDGINGPANVRIEFRALPSQPTIRDSVAFLALFAGLLNDLPRREHPVGSLEWTLAERNFYAAAADGLDANLHWIDRHGNRTNATVDVYEDVFECAYDGLEAVGFERDDAKKLLEPLQMRVSRRETPASWRIDAVRDSIEAGSSFESAVNDAAQSYLERQAETFERGHFATWKRTERNRQSPEQEPSLWIGIE